MPSLRRSFSSPAVRSSPYPTSTSNRARASGQHPRRSSGSSTSERRVLADIEWWRVSDGQCPPHVQDQDQDQNQDDEAQDNTFLSLGGGVMLSAGGGREPPQTPSLSLHGFSLDLTQSMYMNELAAFSIAPHSPSGRHARDASPAFTESSPELGMVPLEVIHLGLGQVSPAVELYSNAEVPLSSSSLRAASPSASLLGFRSFFFGGFPSRENTELQFADMGGDTFSLDQNLFH
ncbi:hypothetical protein F5I97DRAFT_1924165 [Phlebopus sp. FC_14]|nr:hypothetical protein F5I97DRAFT_1924165 [Phlebopus sp. FC_14]